MAAPTPLRYHGIVSGHSDGGEPRLQLIAGGPGGRVREVPLSRAELVRIIRAAAGALESMERREIRP